jgi:hypothetical protein
VARDQPADTASTNSDGAHGDVARGALARYLEDLEGQPLAPRSREAYAAHVSTYVGWLVGWLDAERALREPRARDFAARDFKRHLKLERRWAPSSVNLALAAVSWRRLDEGQAGAVRLAEARGGGAAVHGDADRRVGRVLERVGREPRQPSLDGLRAVVAGSCSQNNAKERSVER